MGENPSLPHHAEPLALGHQFRLGAEDAPKADGLLVHHEEEEPYTIKCICGFADDKFDGNTVFCDRCQTWQHIACYYYPHTTLEDDFEHTCADCNPKYASVIDSAGAAARQQSLRQPQTSNDDRKAKRPAPKNQKKTKARDLNNHNQPYTNGWGSPDSLPPEQQKNGPNNRVQGPPNKKPKTSHHKPSNSINTPSGNLSRLSGHRKSIPVAKELPMPPLEECPSDYFSPDFIRVHRNNTKVNHTPANLHVNIAMPNLLSTWLDDQEAFAEATDGLTHNDVFLQFPYTIEDHEAVVKKRVVENHNVEFHGEHPIWPLLTVEKPLAQGEVVGELRGTIGLLEEYLLSKEWAKLHHPDHFVFFHPALPIYIDARTEGNNLRYLRRSCWPNVEMQTMITGAREYRFCFIARRPIAKDEEVTIAWDTKTDEHLSSCLNRGRQSMTDADFDYVCDWVGTNLAHFGGCACEGSQVNNCLLSNFDRRLAGVAAELDSRPKNRGKKPAHNPAIPDSGNSVNSRASSDGPGNRNNGDVDMADTRSASPSSASKSEKTSRDGTPRNSKDDVPNPNIELSRREKRKLEQQEKIFQQMEHDKSQHGQKRKKRASGSNGQNSRAATSASYPNTPLPPARDRGLSNPNPYFIGVATRDSPSQMAGENAPSRPRREFRDQSSQVEPEIQKPLQIRPKCSRRISYPLVKRVLKRSFLHHHIVNSSRPPSPAKSASHPPTEVADAHGEPSDQNADAPKEVPDVTDQDSAQKQSAPPQEVEFSEEALPSHSGGIPNPASPGPPIADGPHTTKRMSDSPQPPKDTPIPPVEPSPPPEKPPHQDNQPGSLRQGMHVDVPPPPTFAASTSNDELRSNSDSMTSAPVMPSPMTIGPLTSQSLPSATSPVQEGPGLANPSPAKKKMSLSEYTKFRKKTPATEKAQSQAQLGGPTRSPGAVESTNRQDDSYDSAANTKEHHDAGTGTPSG
ncbi:MAG: hypothetical protein M1831_003920 [Alyxoria varia]|nr:MAG: hypothetical protein M1831_003920 [Alyxoria varia]